MAHHGGKAHQSKSKGVTKGSPKPGSRFEKYPGGAVPSAGRSPKDQLKFLDQRGFVAKKERAKLLAKIEKEKQNETK